MKKRWAKNKTVQILLLLSWTVFVIFACQIIFAIIFSLLFKDFQKSPILISICSILCYIATLSVIYLPHKYLKNWKTSRIKLGLKDLPTFTDVLLSPVGLIIHLVLAFGLVSLFSLLFPWFNADEVQNMNLPTFMSYGEKLISFICLAIITPIIEEVIFRGWLYDRIKSLLPKKYATILAIVIISVLFGFIHGQWNVAVNVFTMSVVACLLREMTGTIYAGILVHVLKNTIAFLLVYVFGFS